MTLPIQLISTDFDGTLFAEFERPPVPEALQYTLADLQSKGVKWVINTGRDLSSLMETMARAGFRVQPDYVVVVEREIYQHIEHEYVSLESWNNLCTEVHDELFAQVQPDLERITAWINERFNVTLYADDYSPLCFIAGNNPTADKITEYLEDYCKGVPGLTVVRNDIYARLSHRDFNKGSALGEITRILGLNSSQVFAAGDHFNDLPMLKAEYAAMLAAPVNAIGPVKQQVEAQGGYISHQSCGQGILRAIEFYLERPIPKSA